MEFRIADTFTDSLARLTDDEQKAVKTTAFDLQMNPAHPGMNFHKLDKAKDKNFWSVRVDRDIRLIVHKSEGSLMLCYVDHHDKAYSWAERRKLETHPKTGAAQMVEIRETVQEILIPSYVAAKHTKSTPGKSLLFANFTDDELLGYGVPAEWLNDVRAANEDTLLVLADRLPSEASEALLEIATGGKPRPVAATAKPVKPFEHPDALRRFRVMSNLEELERALEFPWDKWSIFLHPDQRQLVERTYTGPARVCGSAGTGKTIVAVHRAVFLARANPNTQLLWESTLRDPNLATIAWNIFTALYYKAGNSPWRLQTLPEQTCFVGVSFFKENPTAGADMQTSLAQIFGAGEGIVLRGEKAVVDKKRDRKAHLTEEGAFNLLSKAIEQYKLQHSLPPKRVVVHKTSRYWPEESKGFKRALGDIYHFDLLAIETRNIRFMRLGKKRPLRGTVVQLGERNYLLFGNGYIPYLRAYPGKRIPRPLEIVEHHGASTAQTVCHELLALTKLNWNSCAFGSSIPITIRFARDVGKILTELPTGAIPETKYKYYM